MHIQRVFGATIADMTLRLRTISAGAAATSVALLLHGCGGGGPANTLPSNITTLPGYVQTSLVSDQVGLGQILDANLISPWGIIYSPTGNWVVPNAANGTATVYTGGVPNGTIAAANQNFKIPFGGATGAAFNPSTDFKITNGAVTAPSTFIVVSVAGWICGWNATVSSSVAIAATTITNAIYTGVAVGNNLAGNFIFATDFSNGTIDVFDKDFALVTLTAGLKDPTIPPAFHPFGIQNIGGKLYVTYAKYDPSGQTDVPAPGNGYVDVYDTSGNLLSQLVAGGNLNSPIGVAVAPATFKAAANMLLVANYGDGMINVYDPKTGAYIGSLSIDNQTPISIPGLRCLMFGNGASAGAVGSLYYTAGPRSQPHGQFGRIDPPAVIQAGRHLFSRSAR